MSGERRPYYGEIDGETGFWWLIESPVKGHPPYVDYMTNEEIGEFMRSGGISNREHKFISIAADLWNELENLRHLWSTEANASLIEEYIRRFEEEVLPYWCQAGPRRDPE